MKDKMTVRINGISHDDLDKIIEVIGSRSLAEVDIKEDDLFDIILNPECTTIETIGNNIMILRKDTKFMCYLNHVSFNEVIIC